MNINFVSLYQIVSVSSGMISSLARRWSDSLVMTALLFVPRMRMKIEGKYFIYLL